jgi:hypothetical protein
LRFEEAINISCVGRVQTEELSALMALC